MNFNQPEFAVFLTIVLSAYFFIHFGLKSRLLENLMLVLASVIFYGWWDRRFLFLFLFSTWLDYFCGLAMLHRRPSLGKCAFLFVSALAGAVLLCAPIDWNHFVEGAHRLLDTGHLSGPLIVRQESESWQTMIAAIAGVLTLTVLLTVGYVVTHGHGQRQYFLWLSVITQLSLLGFFKYYDFFIGSLEQGLASAGVDASGWYLGIIVPIGISFYTFHTMSYTIDVYRGILTPTESLIDFALFVSFFPQMIAGPIARAHELLPQFQEHRRIDWTAIQTGTWLIGWGLFKKAFIADNLSRLVMIAYAPGATPSGPETLLATYAFAFQIYADFSAYSDIARGISRIVGVELLLNFNLPYVSTNPREFWRRWHISLSTWLRDYLYVSLGGNRGGPTFVYRNLMLTMVLGGIWHGARANFVWWGAYQGALLCGHRWIEPWLNRYWPTREFISRALTFLSWVLFFQLICFGWLLFRCESNSQIARLTRSLLVGWETFPQHLGPIARMMFYITPLLFVQFFQWRSGNLLAPLTWPWPARAILYVTLFVLVVLFGAFDVTEFIYFQF